MKNIMVLERDISNQEYFYSLPEGTLIKSDLTDYWVKPEQIEFLKDKVINLFSGKIVHFSELQKIIPVYGSEIMW